MAALYDDSSRKRLFVDRARQWGPLSGPEICPVDVLEWSPGKCFRPHSDTQNR